MYIEKKVHATVNKELIVIVDLFSSKFHSDEKLRADLLKLNKEICKCCSAERSGIYLARVGPLLHSKGFLISTVKRGKLIIGSLNLTQKGLRKNEEIMLLGEFTKGSREQVASLAGAFEGYVDALLDGEFVNSTVTRVDRVDVKKSEVPRSLREMFLDGRLYYERKEQDPFRFDLKLPEAMRQSTSNISDFLESTTSNSIDISKLAARTLDVDLPELDQSRSKWKKFCVLTCYGYWSPTCYLNSDDDNDCLAYQLKVKKGNRCEY